MDKDNVLFIWGWFSTNYFESCHIILKLSVLIQYCISFNLLFGGREFEAKRVAKR